VASPKKFGGGPVAESQSLLQQALLQTWDGERAQRQERRQLQQLTPSHLPELLFVYPARVKFAGCDLTVIVIVSVIVIHALTFSDGAVLKAWDSPDALKLRNILSAQFENHNLKR
jgi:hypothetical protein